MKIIQLGSLVEDNITGFKGFAYCRVDHMNGCERYGIQPQLDKDGQLLDAKFFDGPDLKIIAEPKKDLPPTIKTQDTFKLGVKVEDRLTGFTGIAVARIKFMYSGDRYWVQGPVNEKGELLEAKQFDESDLEQIDPPLKKKRVQKNEHPEGPHCHDNKTIR